MRDSVFIVLTGGNVIKLNENTSVATKSRFMQLLIELQDSLFFFFFSLL